MADEVISEFEARRVQQMLRSLYLGLLKPQEQITVSGTRQGDWLAVTFTLTQDHGNWTYPVEARIDLKLQRLRERQAIELLYDFLAEQFQVFLANRLEPFSGPKWEAVDFAAQRLFIRGQIVNQLAENKADIVLDADALQRSRALQRAAAQGPQDQAVTDGDEAAAAAKMEPN